MCMDQFKGRDGNWGLVRIDESNRSCPHVQLLYSDKFGVQSSQNSVNVYHCLSTESNGRGINSQLLCPLGQNEWHSFLHCHGFPYWNGLWHVSVLCRLIWKLFLQNVHRWRWEEEAVEEFKWQIILILYFVKYAITCKYTYIILLRTFMHAYIHKVTGAEQRLVVF